MRVAKWRNEVWGCGMKRNEVITEWRWMKQASRPRVSAEGGYGERPERVGMTSASCTRDWHLDKLGGRNMRTTSEGGFWWCSKRQALWHEGRGTMWLCAVRKASDGTKTEGIQPFRLCSMVLLMRCLFFIYDGLCPGDEVEEVACSTWLKNCDSPAAEAL
jgi:hypothetical protein